MNKLGTAVLAGLAVLIAHGPAAACDDARTAAMSAEPAVVAQAIDRVRQEQREQIERSARVALAQLRSEAATALAQGAAASGTAAVKAAP